MRQLPLSWVWAVRLGLVAAVSASLASVAQPAGPAVPRFVEETAVAGVVSRYDGDWEFTVGGGVAAFDCDDDGLPELFLAGGANRSALFLNASAPGGPLRFRRASSGLELERVTGAYPLDVDGDGRLDLAVLRVGEDVLMRGLGGCRFERANEAWGFDGGGAWSTAFAATWERGNAWPTLAFGAYVDRSRTDFPWGSCTDNRLFRPTPGGRRFGPPLPLKPSFCALSMLFTDWDRSGEPALRVSNDREYYRGGQEQLWRVPSGASPRLYTAADGWKPLVIWGMGIASYDLTGDGKPEYYLTSMSDNKLQALVDGARGPAYADVAFARGATAYRPYAGGDTRPSTAWHAQFEDVNNDGFVDLFVAKGNVASMPDFAADDPNNLLLGRPDGSFVEAGDRAGVASPLRGRGAQVVDLNADGLLDLVVVNRWAPAQVWRNVGAGTPAQPRPLGGWVGLRLRQPGANRDAVGAWVEVDLGGRTVRRELTVGGGHASGSLGWVQVGVGSAVSPRVRVQWPGSGWGPWQGVGPGRFYVLERGAEPRPWTPRPSVP